MQFTATIIMGNSAFGDTDSSRGAEVARQLREMAARVESGIDSGDNGYTRDINGNTCGTWEVMKGVTGSNRKPAQAR